MLFSNIIKNFDYTKIHNFNNDIRIKGISSYSKTIRKNFIFLVDYNKKIKKSYINEAINKGAVLIVTNKFIKNINIPQLKVMNINLFLNKILFKLYNKAPKNIVGVTGTNGKTSVVWITSNILKLSKLNVVSLGTIGLFKNLKKISDSRLTTPEKEYLHKVAFSSSLKNNSEFIFEISSHGISKKRISGFPINIAAITNIGHDHLDFHKTFKNYRNIKLKLFTKYLSKKGIAILNDNIIKINQLKKELLNQNIKIISYGKKKSDINCTSYGSKKIKVQIYKKNYVIDYQVNSIFELENLSCSISCSLAVGLSSLEIIRIIPKIKRAEGRMEFVGQLKNGAKIFVDYAHTPDALKSVLTSNILKKQKPDLVFGCGGDRDKSKRKVMAKIANRFANKVYITDDNPRSENPKIIRKILHLNCNKAQEIANRKYAIKEAINNLNTNSILIIAGKGHEKKQIYLNKILSFDDATVAKFFIRKINQKT